MSVQAGFPATTQRHQLLLMTVVCLACVLLLAARLHVGFLPQDDPALGHVAERTLHGELPNVDFFDDYTGGLSYLDALALKIFGVRLLSLRIMLLLFFIPWIASVWYLAARIVSPLKAALATLLAAVWSVPVYPTPFGSWYNLYFATFGTAALFRYIETRRRHWLFWAGVCAGLSFVAKIFALYFMAAAALFLIYDEQEEAARGGSGRAGERWTYSLFVSAGLAVFVLALVKLIGSAGAADGWQSYFPLGFHFVLPGAALALLLIWREWSAHRGPALPRFAALAWRAGYFAVGVAIPIAVFLLPYWRRHAVGKWASNLLLSSARLHHTSFVPPGNSVALLCLPLLLLLWANAEWTRLRTRKLAIVVLSILLGLVLLKVRGHLLASGFVFFSLSQLLPILVIIGAIVLYQRGVAGGAASERLLLLLAAASTLALFQFPVAAPIYFCLVAPFVVLVLMALTEATAPAGDSLSLMLPVFAFYLLIGLFVILPGQFYRSYFDNRPEAALTLPRARGFIGDRDMVEINERAVNEVLRHAGDAPIYAGPDSPGFYFLAGRANPTPIYMDFLAGDDAQPRRILEAIDGSGVKAVAINHGGSYTGYAPYNPSGPPSPELLEGLRQRFPNATVIGYYEIRWRP
jgi:hypothetical protein